MRFGNYLDNPFLTNKLNECNDGFHYTISDYVDENGCYDVEFDGSEDEFFAQLGYRLASDVEKEFLSIMDKQTYYKAIQDIIIGQTKSKDAFDERSFWPFCILSSVIMEPHYSFFKNTDCLKNTNP